jgi:glycine amidinotransferase
MSQRSRWYEYIAYRPILERYFKEDPEFLWEAAPKPRLTDESFEPGYWRNFFEVWTLEEKMERSRRGEFKNSDKEPLFDAADALRCGKDIFVQLSLTTSKAGIDWLRRHLEPRGLRLHEVRFEAKMPWHIDTTVFVPREGLLFQNPNWMPLNEEFHELFRMNGWEIVMCAPPGRSASHEYSSSSFYLGYNVFSLDPKAICVEAAEEPLMDQLSSYGFEPIPLDFDDVSPFGGGLHCATVDVYREGDCEDYFPKQIPGY